MNEQKAPAVAGRVERPVRRFWPCKGCCVPDSCERHGCATEHCDVRAQRVADARILAQRDKLPPMNPRTPADLARVELLAIERYLIGRCMLDEFSLTNLWVVVGPWHGAHGSCPHKVDCATNRKCNGDCVSA